MKLFRNITIFLNAIYSASEYDLEVDSHCDGQNIGTEYSPICISIECNSDAMTVKFPIDAIYENASKKMNADQLSRASAQIGDSDNSCFRELERIDHAESGSIFQVMVDFNDCGTEFLHEDDKLVFKNTISGGATALKRDGIITTKSIGFHLQCDFPDTFISTNDITVTSATNLTSTVSGMGQFEFEIASFLDSSMKDPANEIDIGQALFSKVSTSSDITLPENVQYHVTKCRAYDDADLNQSYEIMSVPECYFSELIQAELISEIGTNIQPITFQFNSFTFSPQSNNVNLECEIKLCLTDEVNCYQSCEESRAVEIPDEASLEYADVEYSGDSY